MGFLVALLNAAAVGLHDVLVKKLAGENKFYLLWVRMAAALPVMAVLVTFFAAWAIPEESFWLLTLAISVPFEIFAFWLAYTAIQTKEIPLSLAAPLHGFTAVFLIPVSYLVLGELPSPLGFAGVFSIFIGAFFLGGGGLKSGVIGPYRKLLQTPGSWLILFAALLVTVPITVAKITFAYASPLLTAFYISAGIAIVVTPLALQGGMKLRITGSGKYLAASGILSGVSMSLHYIGLSLLPSAYFISVKRTSMLFNVFFGRYLFLEEEFRERLTGAACMIVGVLLIAFA